MLMLFPSLLSLLLLLQTEAGPTVLRQRREAEPLLGGLVSDLTSPFINFFRGPSKAKKPRRPVHHHTPVHHHAPVHHHVHHHPAPPPVHHSVEPAAPKPQIHVLPAPDLTHQPQTYVVQPEQPAVAPPYEAPVYQPTYQPAEPPAYQPAVAPAYEPIYYADESPPVYEPQTYEPAAVDTPTVSETIVPKTTPVEEPAVEEPAVEEPEEEEPVAVDTPNVSDLVGLKSAEEEPLEVEEVPVEEAEVAVDVVPVQVEEAERTPKLLLENPSPFNDILAEYDDDAEEIIIDLTKTDDLTNEILSTPVQEEEEEVLEESEPQIISFTTNQIPNVFAPVQKSEQVINFRPVDTVEVKEVEVLEEPEEVIADTELLPLDLEVIDFNSDNTGDGFALIDEDYIDQELEDELDLDILIPELGLVEEEAEEVTATENIDESLVTTTSSSIVQTTLSEFEAVPEIIASDPVFKEIVSDIETEDKQQSKRGFTAYDPRKSRVYAHKYSDEFSNWYFFRRGY